MVATMRTEIETARAVCITDGCSTAIGHFKRGGGGFTAAPNARVWITAERVPKIRCPGCGTWYEVVRDERAGILVFRKSI